MQSMVRSRKTLFWQIVDFSQFFLQKIVVGLNEGYLVEGLIKKFQHCLHIINNKAMIGNEDDFHTTEKKTKKKSTKSKVTSPFISAQLLPHKTLLCQITRIKGQQKLLYVKQCKSKNIDPQQMFAHYPSCQLETFTFNLNALKESVNIVKNEQGIHWVQQLTGADSQLSVFNGWAISIMEDGSIFQGIYHDSKPCGLGYQLNPNGNTYVGNFKEGNKSGQGKFYWFNSSQAYIGQWSGGLPHGHGKYLSNEYYEGQFCNGLKHGDGQELFQNGDRYLGQFINGIADGYGEYFWADGSVYKGDFKHGVRHGYGIWSDKENKQIYQGSYRMDKKQGYGIYEWTAKQIYKGHFREDYRDGFGKLYTNAKRGGDEEKLVYQGMWIKGKERKDLSIDNEASEQLQVFLSEKKSSPKKKQRVGHKNCIPKNY